jgi:hypothetical protein
MGGKIHRLIMLSAAKHLYRFVELATTQLSLCLAYPVYSLA